MKKTLLFVASVTTVLSAASMEPMKVTSSQLYAVSPNGHYLAGNLFETFAMVNTITGEVTRIPGEGEETAEAFSPGNCNAISDAGFIVGNTSENGPAAVMRGTEIELLQVPDMELTNLANSITPDGLYIVGSVGMAKMSIEDTEVPMQVPAIWTLGEDGKYGAPEVLPYPSKDFSGRTPQYVSALVVTDDGKKIFGQVKDYSGMLIQMIQYTKDDEGKWAYELLGNDLINPDHLVFPEWPGEAPEQPSAYGMLTETQRAEYQAAYDAWMEECLESGDWTTPAPEYDDFLTEEQKAELAAALEKYNEEFPIWSEKYDEFNAIFSEVSAKATVFVFNSMKISGNNRYVCTTAEIMEEDPMSFFGFTTKNAPAILTVENSSIELKSFDFNISPTTIFDDGTMLCCKQDANLMTFVDAYAWVAGQDSPIDYVSYLEELNEGSATWVKENCTHEITYEVPNYDTGEYEMVTEERLMIGVPMAAGNRSVFCNYVAVMWEDDENDLESYVNSYVYDAKETSKVNGLFNSIFEVKALRSGRVVLTGDVATLMVSDMNGRVAFNGRVNAGIVDLGVSSGAYIIKATAKDGNTKVLKAIF